MTLSPLTPGAAPLPVVLEGRAVRVRPLVAQTHAPALFSEIDGPQLAPLFRYLPMEVPAGPQEFTAQIAEWQARPATLQFLFEDKASGRPAGTSSYMRITPEHRVMEVGYVLIAPWAQRSILSTEAHYLLARHAFEALGYRRYEWKCNDRNEASRAAALRLGFRYEGTFRNHMIVKGESRDTAWFSITDAEWPGVRARLEHWLSPENFDAEGCQRSSLSSLQPK